MSFESYIRRASQAKTAVELIEIIADAYGDWSRGFLTIEEAETIDKIATRLSNERRRTR